MPIQEFESQEALDDTLDQLMEKEQENEWLKSIKPTATPSWSLNIERPKCKEDIDLAD